MVSTTRCRNPKEHGLRRGNHKNCVIFIVKTGEGKMKHFAKNLWRASSKVKSLLTSSRRLGVQAIQRLPLTQHKQIFYLSSIFRIWRFYLVIFFVIQSCWPRVLRRGSAASCLLELRVRILKGAWMSVFCELCVLSGRGLCYGPIRRPGGVLPGVYISMSVTRCNSNTLPLTISWQKISDWDKNEIKKETFEGIHPLRGSVIGKSIAIALLKQNMFRPTGAMGYVRLRGSIRPSTWKWRSFGTLYPTLGRHLRPLGKGFL